MGTILIRMTLNIRDQSLLMTGRGPEDIFIDNEHCSQPVHLVTKVFKDPWSYSCNFLWPLSVSNLMKIF